MDAERELGEMAIKYNVAGFTKGILDRHTNYLPRLFSDARISTLRNKFGDKTQDAVATLVERAIRQAQPDIAKNPSDREIIDMARGMLKLFCLNYGKYHRAFEFTMEDLKKVLKEEQIAEPRIDEMIDALSRTVQVGKHKRARPRLFLDETVSIDVRMDDGSIEVLRFEDLLEEDIENLHNAYIFQMSGAIGLARNGINTNDADSTIDALIGRIRQEAVDTNQSTADLNDELAALEFMYDGITGRLAYKDGQPSFSTR